MESWWRFGVEHDSHRRLLACDNPSGFCRQGLAGLLLDAVGVFLDDGIGEDLACDALDFGAGGVGVQAVGERKCEVFALTHGGDIGKTDLAKSVVDRLSLRIEDRCLQRDVDMRLHNP